MIILTRLKKSSFPATTGCANKPAPRPFRLCHSGADGATLPSLQFGHRHYINLCFQWLYGFFLNGGLRHHYCTRILKQFKRKQFYTHNFMAKVLGIDLGTTNSCMAVMEGGEPLVLENSEGKRTTPSVVAFTKTGERVVGDAAKRQAVTNSRNTIYSIKRFMGRKFDEVQEEIKRMPYKVVKASNGDCAVEVEVDGKPKQFSPPEISAMILSKLKADAETRLGEKITQAVITVPAYFNDSQRQATKDAGKIAGLEVLRIINEPTAASLAYGLDKKKDEKIAVYDLGGGTFDISVFEIGDGVFEVKATNGDTHLGGDDWDNMPDGLDSRRIQKGIRHGPPQAARRAPAHQGRGRKSQDRALQLADTTTSICRSSRRTPAGRSTSRKLSRAPRWSSSPTSLFERTIAPVKACLKDAGIEAAKIDELVLVGGMTRMPRVVETAHKLVNKPPHQGVNPDEVVAIGAGIQGGVLKGEVKDVLLLDVTPLSLGIETLGGVFTRLIERNTTIPSRKSEIFSTASDNQPGVEIHVLQGERQFSRDNKTIGKFQLADIPPAPRGVPQIEVTFDIDANGILHVGAKDLGTGKEQKITITASSGLSKDEVEKMRKDAEAHAEEDKAKKEEVETRNEADNAVYRTEKLLKDNADKISGDDKTKIETAVSRREGSVERQRHRRHQIRQREAERSLAGRERGTVQSRRREGPGGKAAGAGPRPAARRSAEVRGKEKGRRRD